MCFGKYYTNSNVDELFYLSFSIICDEPVATHMNDNYYIIIILYNELSLMCDKTLKYDSEVVFRFDAV